MWSLRPSTRSEELEGLRPCPHQWSMLCPQPYALPLELGGLMWCFSLGFLVPNSQTVFYFTHVNCGLIRPILNLDYFLGISFGRNSFKLYVKGTLA